MGYIKEEQAPKKLPPLKENNNKILNSEIENRIESSIVQLLESKYNELGKEVEEAKAKKKEIEIENSMLKSTVMNLERV
jgi:hypothetical protein